MRTLNAVAARGRKENTFEHLPRRTLLTVSSDDDGVGHARCADVQIRSHPRDLPHECLQAITCGRENFETFGREIDTGRRVGDVDEWRSSGDGDRLADSPEAHRLI